MQEYKVFYIKPEYFKDNSIEYAINKVLQEIQKVYRLYQVLEIDIDRDDIISGMFVEQAVIKTLVEKL